MGFAPSQLLCQRLLLSDVHSCPHEPPDSCAVNDWNTDTAYVTNLPIWPHDPLREVKAAIVGKHPVNFMLHEHPIVRVYQSQILFDRWRVGAWIEAVNLE
jgi:hypothetical protein